MDFQNIVLCGFEGSKIFKIKISMPLLYPKTNRISRAQDSEKECFLCEAPLEIIMGSEVDN